MMLIHPSRRTVLALTAAALVPGQAMANIFREITWNDLIPANVPPAQIVGPGKIDPANDTWVPEYDKNAGMVNTTLDDTAVKLPGYIIPFDVESAGVTTFMLVPYIGACIHTPPPPPNQLVFVTTQTPWPNESLWDPVWVSGHLTANPMSTELGNVGYQITADLIEVYKW